MSCACFNVGWERIDKDAFSVGWERFCATMVDLVAFSASDGMFYTKEGYTILVKI